MDLKKIRDRCREDGDCWIWAQAVNSTGYPQCSVNGKGGVLVKRLSLLASGKKPYRARCRVTSTCGEKLCCNPEHLKWSTASEVLIDGYRSRGVTQTYGSRLKGALKGNVAKLDWERVRQIRARLETESVEALAKEYGVGWKAIRRIQLNRSWRVASPWR